MLVFDTLMYSEKLQAVGVTKEQAKVQAEALKEAFETHMATKQDLKELELRLNAELQLVKQEVKQVELRLSAEIALVKAEVNLLKWMTGLVLGGIIALIVKTFFA